MLPVAMDPIASGIASLFLIIVLLGIVASIFWIVELVDAARRQFYDPNMKIVWILVIFFGHILGALIYYIVGKKQGDL